MVFLTLQHPSFCQETVVIVEMYVSPKVSLAELKKFMRQTMSALEGSLVVLLGDFNVDLLKRQSSPLLGVLPGYRQCITTPTTDYQSLLDHIYTNVPQDHIQSGVFESYFTDHKPIWALLNGI